MRSVKSIACVGFSVGLLILAACSAPPPPELTPTLAPTAQPTSGTVTDLSAPLSSTEAGALVDRGFMGQGDLGRLDRGCSVTVLKVTDRAAQVDASTCQTIDGVAPIKGVQGWVARSALSLR